MTAAFAIGALACPCGSTRLVLVVVGSEPVTHPQLGVIVRGEPDRAWCSLDHARRDGWPWLTSEARRGRAAA